jgi:hypothetical protein
MYTVYMSKNSYTHPGVYSQDRFVPADYFPDMPDYVLGQGLTGLPRREYGIWELDEISLDGLSSTARLVIHDDLEQRLRAPNFVEMEDPWLTHGRYLALPNPVLGPYTCPPSIVAAEIRQNEQGGPDITTYSLRICPTGTSIEWQEGGLSVAVRNRGDVLSFLTPALVQSLADLLMSPYCVAYDPRLQRVTQSGLANNGFLRKFIAGRVINPQYT